MTELTGDRNSCPDDSDYQSAEDIDENLDREALTKKLRVLKKK